ncbi:MAG: M4 family metallopeptidase [Anaerolineae bacterium]
MLYKFHLSSSPPSSKFSRTVFTVSLLVLLVGVLFVQPISAQDTRPTPDAAALLAQQGARITFDAHTGAAHYIGAATNQPIAVTTPLPPNPSRDEVARGFLSQFGGLFGLRDQAQELTIMSQKAPDNTRSFVRFQQLFQGVPVLGGELIVQVTASNRVVSANGEISPNIKASVVPAVNAAAARDTALNIVSKNYQIPTTQLTATTPQLWIYDPKLISPETGPVRLVWRMDVSGTNGQPIRELVLVEAQTGSIALHFNQIDALGIAPQKSIAIQSANNTIEHTAASNTFAPPSVLGSPFISVYNKNHSTDDTTPGTLMCTQANPAACNSDADAQAAYTYALSTYNFYASNFSRDSINGSGMTIISSVHLGTNFQNAYWNGAQMFYGDGFSTGDDVVGHELTHGVTQYESNLFYFYQSGAINESLSDVFGEYMDLTNGLGNDIAGVRWLMGEDIPIGAIRSMSNPPAFSDPDRMTSVNYYETAFCPDQPQLGYCDNGGVHINSGVNNKAAFLIADGGTFNGQTVTGLGITKAAKIYYEVQTNLLTSGSDYADLYNALYQGCVNLIGTVGITADDCQEVRDATNAVEMNLQPAANYNPEAQVCPNSITPVNLFSDTFESGFGNWSLAAISGVNQWTTADSVFGPNAHSGLKALYADDFYSSSNSAATMVSGVTLPANAYLLFNHDYDLESGYDAGLIEYSANGGAWINAGSLIDSGKTYDGVVSRLGITAFNGASHGYVSTRLNLSSLAGQNVKFRWRLTTDTSVYYLGWWLDDVQIYTCPQPPTISSFTPTSGPKATSVNITGTNFINVSAVTFNGLNAGTFTVLSSTSINAVVPYDATSGPIGITTSYGSVASASNFTVTPPVNIAIGNYEETNADLIYSGNWLSYTGTGPKGGSTRYSNDPNARVSFGVVSTAERVIIYHTMSNDYGPVGVYVDGGFIGNMPTSSTLTWGAPYTINLTPNGNPRFIELRNASTKYIGFEAFAVAPAPAPFALGSYEETNFDVTYTGNWVDYAATGPKGGSMRYTNDPNARASFSVVSTAERVIIYRTLASGYGPVGVYVDGGFIGNMPTSTTLTWGAPYLISLTPNGNPRTIELRNTSSQYVGFEAFDVALAPAPLALGSYEETNSNLTYTGNWVDYAATGPKGGSMRYTNDPNARVSFSVVSTAERVIIYRTLASSYGPVGVYVDGGFIGNMPTSSTLTWSAPYTIVLTPNGNPRTIELRNTSSQYFGFEAFDVTLAPPPPTPLPLGNYEETNANLVYAGIWQNYISSSAKGGSMRYSNDPNATLTFSVVSTAERVIIYHPLSSGYGPIGVYVDGGFIGNMPTSTTLTWGAPYTIVLTPNGNPRTIELRNTSSQYMGVEAIDVTLAPPPPAPLALGSYEETNASIVYTGAWLNYVGSGPKGGNIRYSNDANARVSFSVVSTAERVIIYHPLSSNYGPIGVYVDGGFVGNMPTSTTLTWSSPYAILLTPNGNPRTIELRNTSSQYIGVEGIDVTLTPTPPPPLGAGLYQENAAGLTYSGVWATYSGSGPNGGSLSYSNDLNAQVSFSISGDALRIYRTKAFNRGPITVCVDSVLPCTTVNNTDSGVVWNVPVVIGSLGAGTHNIVIRNASSSTSQYIDIDAIEVLATTPPSLSQSTTEPTQALPTADQPTAAPTDVPTVEPSPTPLPTEAPTVEPTPAPTEVPPTPEPSPTPLPTDVPTEPAAEG